VAARVVAPVAERVVAAPVEVAAVGRVVPQTPPVLVAQEAVEVPALRVLAEEEVVWGVRVRQVALAVVVDTGS
jgi:hypothetical protein